MAALGKVTPALWFEHLFGFKEHVALRQQLPNGQIVRNPAQLREKLELRGERLVSLVNGASYGVGTFSAPSLSELRRRAGQYGDAPPERPLCPPATRGVPCGELWVRCGRTGARLVQLASGPATDPAVGLPRRPRRAARGRPPRRGARRPGARRPGRARPPTS